MGSVTACLVGDFFPWKIAYLIGGGLGLILLVLRARLFESGMYKAIIQNREIKKGNFIGLFTDRKKFIKYIRCILIGLPMWFVVGLLIMLSPEFAVLLQVKGTVTAGSAIMYCYIGLAIGDLAFGFLSQILKTRKKIIFFALICVSILVFVYLNSFNISSDEFYLLCLAMEYL